MSVPRPIMRYHGGKWRIAPWIISHFPEHRVYVEPYGGAGSVLFRKPRSEAEVWNDLDDGVYNVFRVVRHPVKSRMLAAALYMTPWSRREFFNSYKRGFGQVERARRTIVRSQMAFGTTFNREHRTGFRAKTWVESSPATNVWMKFPAEIQAFTERLRGVVLENRPGIEVIKHQDQATTLFYLDPTYLNQTRTSIRCEAETDRSYTHNLTDAEHEELLKTLLKIKGMAIISGYRSEMYMDILSGWRSTKKDVMADGAQKRVEYLWLSPSIPEKQLHFSF